MTDPLNASLSLHKGAARSTPGEVAVARFKELLTRGAQVPPDLLNEFGWPIPLIVSCEPSPYCIPEELFSFHPRESEVFKIFFKGTSKEVRIRQIFFHTPLSDEEQQWLVEFREHCAQAGWKIPLFMEPMVLRIIWLAYRKWGDNIITRSFDLAKMMLEWRQGFFPLSDTEEELSEMLKLGVMYWVGRDQSLRPLLLIRLARLHRHASPEIFKRLTIFCFEWGLRYMMVPGIVETITVLLDVRGVPLHQFPVSALTDMTSTLTKQYPFRLNRMLIINDSFFVQTVWNIAKQFLTEVQQQKMLFLRSGFEEELMKEYTPWQLEKSYGGTRPEAERHESYGKGYLATDRITSMGLLWEKDCRVPTMWAPEAGQVFKDLSLPLPEGVLARGTSAVVVAADKEALKPSEKEESFYEEVAVPASELPAATSLPRAASTLAAEASVAEAVSPRLRSQDEIVQPKLDEQAIEATACSEGRVASPRESFRDAVGGLGHDQEEQGKGATVPATAVPEQTSEASSVAARERSLVWFCDALHIRNRGCIRQWKARSAAPRGGQRQPRWEAASAVLAAASSDPSLSAWYVDALHTFWLLGTEQRPTTLGA
ncbi:hypothetical protein Emag_006630 [Eimeria magna]